jgi:drug/metabolite transporter (DMT)-like permease
MGGKDMWLFFTLATTLIWGLAELFYKMGARPEEKYAHLKTVVCVGIVMGLHACFTLTTQHIGYDPINMIKYLPVTFCYIISMALSYFGMRFVEESISDPIENTSGAIVAVMAVVFLHQKIDFLSAMAIGLILIGILGVGFLDNTGDTDRKKKLGGKLAFIAFAMPFCYAIFDALGTFLDLYYLEMKTTPLVHVSEKTIENVANTSYELTFFIVALLLLLFMHHRKVIFDLEKQGPKILAAVCETAGQFTYVFAMAGNGAIAAPIISSVCCVSLVLSRIVLKERLTKWQYLFLFLIIAGILTLSIIQGDA